MKAIRVYKGALVVLAFALAATLAALVGATALGAEGPLRELWAAWGALVLAGAAVYLVGRRAQ
ncbi:hypothetical protein J0910_30935 [Nocardiopsis sp. CNT-189]|uniref:hypothetical protein n=1 Tax=Nocardiopsis oceanisediminis TaxID=2816862 RepID=UPI003B2A3FA6